MSPKVSAERRKQYVEDRRSQILDAAIEVFGNKGLDVATVDEIAQAVGISKGTIYLYFKSKDEIFDAILAERLLVPQIVDLIDTTKISIESAELTLQSFLERISDKFLSEMDNFYPLLRMVLADAHRFPVQAEHVYNNLILKANQMFAEFLSAQVKAGRIKALESPLITARCFIGMLIIYVLSQEMLGGKKFTPIKRSEWVKETVRLFLEGVQISK
jgi:AcrR family transcriptional regulator